MLKIAAVGGQPDFADLTFTINASEFRYGEFINTIVSLIIIAAAVGSSRSSSLSTR